MGFGRLVVCNSGLARGLGQFLGSFASPCPAGGMKDQRDTHYSKNGHILTLHKSLLRRLSRVAGNLFVQVRRR